MALKDDILKTFETAASVYAVVGKQVLTQRTHVDTGLLRRSMRVESSMEGGTYVGRVIMQHYGPILDNRSDQIKKTPPGPQSVGWIEQTVIDSRNDFIQGFSIGADIRSALVNALNNP